jgi:uncharacterized membrane protein YhiD involved in acid resistance
VNVWVAIGISLASFVIMAIVNIGAIFYWSGKMKVLVEVNKEKITEYKNEMNENFKRLEKKQDKHNNLIERMAIVEQSSKSSHHRQDEFNERLNIIERKMS